MAEKEQETDGVTENEPRSEAADRAGAEDGAEATRSEADWQQQLEEVEAKAEENWNQFLRARAELENLRRRNERELEQAHKYGIEKFAGELLPVKDSLEMGLVAAREASGDIDKLREGAELTLKMFGQAFERFNLLEVDPVGERFDPGKHEAVATQASADHEANTVITVVQKGYMLNDRVLRPAMVVVAKAGGHEKGGTINEKA